MSTYTKEEILYILDASTFAQAKMTVANVLH